MDRIIIFDGLCNLCSGSVNFIIKRDKHGLFHFTPFQSDAAVNLLTEYKINPDDFKSLILIKNKQLYVKSDGALEIVKDLNGLWKLLFIFIIVPRAIRNYCYDIIAENRYKWFGKKAECMIPDPDIKSRFLK